MKKYKKRSVAILISVILLLAFTVVFMLSFLDRINAKMNQGSNETLMNSTRMIQSSINSELDNDEQQVISNANLFALSGGDAASFETLANYAESSDFYRFYYVGLDGTGIDSSAEPVDTASFPLRKQRCPGENPGIRMPTWGAADGLRSLPGPCLCEWQTGGSSLR